MSNQAVEKMLKISSQYLLSFKLQARLYSYVPSETHIYRTSVLITQDKTLWSLNNTVCAAL